MSVPRLLQPDSGGQGQGLVRGGVKTSGINVALVLTGVPKHWAHFVFCHFLGFWSTYRGTSDHFSTALEICYMIATRILKIDLEIA